ncbi:MAG: YceI family protein [Balneolaceae bacterium]|nr:YceI family protein [Balneolaceae bacterium]
MKNSIHLISVFLFMVLHFAPKSIVAQDYLGREGYVEFNSRAPLLEFKGTSNHLNGLINPDDNLVDFYVDLNTLDTGIELRNRHMRESYLNTDRCPFAEFTGDLVSDFDPTLMEAQDAVAEGTFTVNCRENEVRVSGSLHPTEDGIMLEAGFEIVLKDYDIKRPGIVFYELAEEQVVNLSILLKKEAPIQP